jgi:acetoacetyl-CoA synthetase
MMYNASVHTLSLGSSVIQYDGSPLSPSPAILWSLIQEYKVTCLGISPRYLQSLLNVNYEPNKHHDLSSLRMVGAAGSPLKAELYDWIREFVGPVFLNNGTGGTDICNLFVGPCMSLPIFHAEIQVPALGMDLVAWDDDGQLYFLPVHALLSLC